MPPRKPTKKQLDQATLKNLGQIQLTIVASEGNLQRIAALLMFAEWPTEMYKLVPATMPFEEEQPPKLEIERKVVEGAVAPLLGKYVEKHGAERARAMIQSYGAGRVRELTDEHLLGLYNTLQEVLGPADA